MPGHFTFQTHFCMCIVNCTPQGQTLLYSLKSIMILDYFRLARDEFNPNRIFNLENNVTTKIMILDYIKLARDKLNPDRIFNLKNNVTTDVIFVLRV